MSYRLTWPPEHLGTDRCTRCAGGRQEPDQPCADCIANLADIYGADLTADLYGPEDTE